MEKAEIYTHRTMPDHFSIIVGQWMLSAEVSKDGKEATFQLTHTAWRLAQVRKDHLQLKADSDPMQLQKFMRNVVKPMRVLFEEFEELDTAIDNAVDELGIHGGSIV